MVTTFLGPAMIGALIGLIAGVVRGNKIARRLVNSFVAPKPWNDSLKGLSAVMIHFGMSVLIGVLAAVLFALTFAVVAGVLVMILFSVPVLVDWLRKLLGKV